MRKVTLGIHLGHHSSCAVVIDGKLMAAMQQERVTRRKYDGRPFFSNDLPITQCLKLAGVELKDVTDIISSLQSVAPGGVGLRHPLVQPGFNLFDPWDKRHRVISHHLAHAISAFGCSGYPDASILVVDLAGSSTESGQDFVMSFSDYYNNATDNKVRENLVLKTECLSIYTVDKNGYSLLEREFCTPHPTPDVFIQNAASLYDNVARSVFGSENAHGQLMALASLESHTGNEDVNVNELIADIDGHIEFRNGWQERFTINSDPIKNIPLAKLTQNALQSTLFSYARRTRQLGHSDNFCAAGGVFLNILSNSEVFDSGIFENCYFPSSPHDAGISIGCAFFGQRIWETPNLEYQENYSTDRLGTDILEPDINAALGHHSLFITDNGKQTPKSIAKLLQEGKIIARCAGRAEFGPRALGGRSLLASPLLEESKVRLNKIKKRQDWRPVAPIIQEDKINDYFNGPTISPYMNYVHYIKDNHVSSLKALAHPDRSTRAQTLLKSTDPTLYEVMSFFNDETGYPILVNTSLNGGGEPIIDSVEDAITFFRHNDEVDLLLLGDRLISRNETHWLQIFKAGHSIKLSDGTLTNIIFSKGQRYVFFIKGRLSASVSLDIFDSINKNGGLLSYDLLENNSDSVINSLFTVMMLGLMEFES